MRARMRYGTIKNKDMLPIKIKSIQALLELRGLPASRHPLISVINIAELKAPAKEVDLRVTTDLYFIGMSHFTEGCVNLGAYDFDKGVMNFIGPGRVFSFNAGQVQDGWLLLLHPDYLWKHGLAARIKQFEFFDYAMNEALFLSEAEEQTITGLFKMIEQEYGNNIDTYSAGITIPLIETLLGYAERFYQRQFITREVSHHGIVGQLDALLENAFSREMLAKHGIPTVKGISARLNISANYLSGLLKTHTGSNTQQHIQAKIIEKAKEQLMMTDRSVNEIAFELGFEYPQSFSKLFKTKVQLTPLQFRRQTERL